MTEKTKEMEEPFWRRKKGGKAEEKLYELSFFLYRKKKWFLKKYGKKFFPSHTGEKDKRRRELLQCLEPMKEIEKLEFEYSIETMKTRILVILTGGFILLCSAGSALSSGILQDNNKVIRKTYGKGDLNTTLIANVIDETKRKEEVKLLVNERQYKEEELEAFYKDLAKELDKEILLDNEAVGKIQSNMKLPVSLEQYPFRILWETSDNSLLQADGTLGERSASQKGEEVVLTAVISYFDWKKTYEKKITLFPKEESKEEKFLNTLQKQIEEENYKAVTSPFFTLPTTVQGREIRWKEQKENQLFPLFILITAACAGVPWIKELILSKKKEERDREMLVDYQEIISKLSLFMGAGMPMRRAWQRTVSDYLKTRPERKRYAYEEMLLTAREMESGVSEGKSYDHFGKRCRIQNYLKLGTLLSQGLKKGSSNIREVLFQEAENAFQERKNLARKMGEEAGTKLLFPMMLMLGIVMVLIMIPAFLSFSI